MTRPAHTCLLVLLLLTLLPLAGCEPDTPAPGGQTLLSTAEPSALPPAADTAAVTAEYVGSEACAGCHAAAYDTWQGSHHDLALQPANEQSVLSRFPARFEDTVFDKAGERFQITPAGSTEAIPVLYTFGVAPLQQYVIPAGNGALQTFPIAWDSRPEAAGGQRWYALYEGHFEPDDPMHWTGRANRWNSQCADCHSTSVRKHYDPASRGYQTTWAVDDVGCEACHGPGSRHVADPGGSPLVRLVTQADEVNACAPCHARRMQIAEGFLPDAPLLDFYRPQFIVPGLYHTDGQIDDEVYVYGSFLQSRMHLAGVSCSDCHEPHSATLRRPGNETCTLCHQSAPGNRFAGQAAGSFDTPEHHFHAAGSPGAQCVSCHMPSKTYMGVDDRRDHSFRIPRPDLAADLGVPEPCTACHEDRSAQWAAEVIRERFGPDRPSHFAAVFAAADLAHPGTDSDLAGLAADADQPIMVRASALVRLGGYQRGHTLDAIRQARDGEPLLRLAAPLAAAGLAPDSRWRLLAPLLDDPLRSVRQQTVSALLPTLNADPAYRARLAPYLETWIDEQALNLDFPETLTNLAGAYMALGRTAEAEATLEEALAQQANWVPGLMNLADLYRSTGRDPQAGGLLERALLVVPDEPEVIYAHALWLSRQGRREDSLPELERAATLAPERREFAYAWALALNDAGQAERATGLLSGLLERWPDDEQLLIAVVTMLRDQGRYADALGYLDRLIALRPADTELRRFRAALANAAGT